MIARFSYKTDNLASDGCPSPSKPSRAVQPIGDTHNSITLFTTITFKNFTTFMDFGTSKSLKALRWRDLCVFVDIVVGIFVGVHINIIIVQHMKYSCRKSEVCIARNEMMVPGWVCCQAAGCFTSPHVWNHRNCRTAVDSSLRFCLWRAVLEKIGAQSIGWNALGRGLRPPMYEMITIGSNLPALRQSHFAPNPIRHI